MKKFKRVLMSLVGAVALGLALTSCSYNFYNDFHGAGADIESDTAFTGITLEEISKKRNDNEEFVLFLGSSSDENCVKNITAAQKELTNINYEGKVYFFSTKDYSTATKRSELQKTLNIKSTTSTTYGLIAVQYKGKAVMFDTSNPDDGFVKETFKVNSDSISFIAIADYVALYFPVAKN